MNVKLQYIYNQSNILREFVEIPLNLSKAYITYKTSVDIRSYGLMLSLIDPDGDIRLKKLLAKDETIVLSESGLETSVGGVSGEVKKGKWTVIVAVFTEYLKKEVIENGFDIEISVNEKGLDTDGFSGTNFWSTKSDTLNTNLYDWDEVYSSEKRWYKGDFHTHTNLSDGKETVTSATKKAKMMDMDFYVPTEHNLVHTGWVDTDICIVPGIEITSDNGHFNIFGTKVEPNYIEELMMTSSEEFNNKIIDEANQNGDIVSINHPFLTRWKWLFENTDLSKIHTIEIINDPTYTDATPSNDACIRFMDILWNDGHKIYGVGGSDSHNLIDDYYEGSNIPSIAGDPGTYVFMENLSPNNLLKAVKKGNIFVTRFCNLDIKIHSETQEYLPGDEVNEDVVYEVSVYNTIDEMDIFLVENGKYTELNVEKIGNIQKVITKITFNDEYKWARIEVRTKEFDFRAYVNPIYSGKKQRKFKTFKDALSLLEVTYD